MVTRIVCSGMIAALSFGQGVVEAQRPRSAESVVASIIAADRVVELSDVTFDGCPQVDPEGRSVFDALRAERLGDNATFELAVAWRDEYATCHYAPLDEWYREALQLVLRSSVSPLGFLETVPTGASDAMRADLLRAAEDESIGVAYREALAEAAVRGAHPEGRIRATLAAFARRVPLGWVHASARRLGREVGDPFFDALAADLDRLDRAVIATAAQAIADDVSDGYVSADTPGIARLRARLGLRSDLPARSSIPLRRRGGQ